MEEVRALLEAGVGVGSARARVVVLRRKVVDMMRVGRCIVVRWG